MSDLLINGKDALSTWGVRMGKGFINVIDDFPMMKPYIENESRIENGKRISVTNAKEASRQINLPFTIEGFSDTDYRAKKTAFIEELKGKVVNVNVPALGSDVYKLVFLGKSASYSLSMDRTFSKIVLKFEEPNPVDRK